MVQPEIRPTHSPVEVGRLSHRWHGFYTFFNTFQVVGLGISEPSTSINRMVCEQSVTMPILRSWRIHLMIQTYSNSYDRHPWQPLRWRNLLHVNWVWKTKDSSQGPFSEDSCDMFWMVFGVFWVHHCTSIAHKNPELLSSHFFTLTPLSFDVCFFFSGLSMMVFESSCWTISCCFWQADGFAWEWTDKGDTTKCMTKGPSCIEARDG